MSKKPIIIIVNENQYNISVDDPSSLDEIPFADRLALKELLNGLNSIPAANVTPKVKTKPRVNPETKMSTSEANDLAAQLILQEQLNQKPLDYKKHFLIGTMVILALVVALTWLF